MVIWQDVPKRFHAKAPQNTAITRCKVKLMLAYCSVVNSIELSWQASLASIYASHIINFSVFDG